MRVWCVSSECIHNKSNLCNAKEINIKDGYVNTASNGQMHYQLCRMYKPNKEYQQIENNMKKWLRDKFLKENLDTEEKLRLTE